MLDRIINKSHFKAQFKTITTKACHNNNKSLHCSCTSLTVTVDIFLPKNESNYLVLNPGSERLFNKNNESYLFSDKNSITLTKHLKIKPNQNLLGSNYFRSVFMLTEPTYHITLVPSFCKVPESI